MTMFRLGIGELIQHMRLTLVMALAVGIPLMVYFMLGAYQRGLESRYAESYEDFLVVQVSGSLGEFYGSRMLASVGEALRAAQLSLVVPEIHTIVGTTTENAVLLRGIPLDSYSLVEEYKIVAGRPLAVGDQPRLAMVGARLAEERKLLPGDAIQVRGRDFQVVGIFDVHTYASNEVWIALEDAQALLGWGTDVSVYVIPNGEAYQEGDALPGGISVVRKGDSGAALLAEWSSFFRLLTHITSALGIAAAVALASILWRLAWLQRRELAILRSIGYGKGSLAGYLFAQGSVITLAGFLLGGMGAFTLGKLTAVKTAGISIQAVFDSRVMLASFIFAVLISVAGTSLPAWWLNRFNLINLLRSE
jgi:ABC-type lipoprotein release transport system permease subunit